MDWLWSPWRYRYVSQAAPHPNDADTACIFCDKGRDAAHDRQSYLLYRGRFCFALLNLYPYTNGHLMVAPYQHVAELSLVSLETLAEMMELAQRTERIFKQAYHCDGINLGMNLGRAAGAGIAGHLHMHILPRWFGDSNFMTTVAETRVMPEDLETSYNKLQPLFNSNA
jgi:ATP adenylyltransferase